MKKFFQKLILYTYIKIHTIFLNIGIILYRAEESMEADPNNVREADKKIIRKRHRNAVLEKFYAGQSDEKYVKEYYELLKKADVFMRKSTPYDLAVATDKHLRFWGDKGDDERGNKKDQYGRRYEHYGFFDEKHKHAGKTIAEVLELEKEERRTKDDDYELLGIFSNKPIEVGLTNIMDVVEKTNKKNVDFEYEVLDVFRKSKQFEFPIKAIHNDENIANKIEQLTEFLHIKKIGFEHRQLEFFIPLKFKTSGVTDQSDIFKELTDIKEIFIRDEYGELIGYGITKFIKRIIHNDTHEVWKFQGIEMKNMSI
jgi:hypothetical protein